MTRSEFLHAAEVCVCGQREEDYGTPEDSFRVIGELWETYIKEKCVGDPAAEVCIVPEDVAALLALLKMRASQPATARATTGWTLRAMRKCALRMQRPTSRYGSRRARWTSA